MTETRCAIYARKSTPQPGRDNEDLSVTRQVDNAKAFAVARGWTVDDAHVYVDDDVGGAEVHRLKAKARMLEVIASGQAPFSVLVMQANDRLSRRDGDEAFGELKAIARTGVQVWFYGSGQQFRYGDFASNTLGFLNAEFAAEFRRQIAAKTREALVRKAERGHVCGGRTYGYDNVRENSHVAYRVNETEAAVVRQVFALYAGGAGLATIAHTLNADFAPNSAKWSPGTLRAMLERSIYRGVLTYGRLKKRDMEGHIRQRPRPEDEWLRVPVPHLRLVPEDVSEAVDARFASQAERTLRLGNGRLLGRPPGRAPGEGSPYLLVGLLRCGTCGGSMEVLSRATGKKGRRSFEYKCYAARRKGTCANKVPAPMSDTDTAVVRAIEDTLLAPEVVAQALAHAEALLARDTTAEERDQVAADLRRTEQAIARLTEAIAEGGDLRSLVDALGAQETKRRELRARLDGLLAPRPTVDLGTVRHTLESYLKDWTGLLRGHIPQAQQILRRLIRGRLTMTPVGVGQFWRRAYYEFAGVGTVRPVISGAVRNVVSPTGFEPVFRP